MLVLKMESNSKDKELKEELDMKLKVPSEIKSSTII